MDFFLHHVNYLLFKIMYYQFTEGKNFVLYDSIFLYIKHSFLYKEGA